MPTLLLNLILICVSKQNPPATVKIYRNQFTEPTFLRILYIQHVITVFCQLYIESYNQNLIGFGLIFSVNKSIKYIIYKFVFFLNIPFKYKSYGISMEVLAFKILPKVPSG